MILLRVKCVPQIKGRISYCFLTCSLGLSSTLLALFNLHPQLDVNSFALLQMASSPFSSPNGPTHAVLDLATAQAFDHPRNMFALGKIFEERGDYEVAAAVYHTLSNRQEYFAKSRDADATDNSGSDAAHRHVLYESHYRASLCNQKLNDTANAVRHAELAHRMLPRREPFYYLAQYFDRLRDNDNATKFYRLASYIPLPAQVNNSPPDDLLSALETDLYTIDIDREIVWPRSFLPTYFAKLAKFQHIIDNNDTSERVLEAKRDRMVITLAKPLLEHANEIFRREGKFQNDSDFYYSTPTLVRRQRDKDFIIICRLINYRLDPVDRHYRDFLPPGDPGHVMRSGLALHRGVNDQAGELVIISDEMFQKSHTSFMGAEDPRLFQHVDGRVFLSMTSWEYSSVAGRGARMTSGILNVPNATLEVQHVFPSPFDREWEKNWIVFHPPASHKDTHAGESSWGFPHVIYEWHPLRIGTMTDEQSRMIDFNITVETPRSFRFLRGSSNGVVYQEQVWFMVHGVAKDYNYYHQFVVLDRATFNVVQYTYPFKLEGNRPTEFCLGLDINPDTHIMTVAYSVMDGSSVLRQLPMWKLNLFMAKGHDDRQQVAFKAR